jgi:hypothetical protein
MTPENPHAPSRSTPQKRLAVYLSDVHGGTIARAVGTNAMTQWKGSIPAANQRHAAAVNYCLSYHGNDCSFTTMAQCQATASGLGAECFRNDFGKDGETLQW